MFFQGTLQDGISTAVQASKQVVCFVTDGGDESQLWENEFLQEDAVKPGLENSVVLRLVAESQEAKFLEALFPVPKKPTIVVIKDGQLKEYIASGETKENFLKRLSNTFRSGVNQTQSSAPSVSGTSAPASSAAPATQPTTFSTAATSNSTSEEGRIAEEKRAKARAEAEEEARRRVNERVAPGEPEPTNPEQKHANKIKQDKQKATEERKRILQRIEDDKIARKEREAEERKARQLLSNPDAEAEQSTPNASKRASKAVQGDHCNLQVRLLDGSTIRSKFESDGTLGKEVRKWIDEQRTDGDAPYQFRVVLTPLPNRVIQPQEEIKSLLSLKLVPSATLVLVPTRYSSAYASAGSAISRGFNPIIGLFASVYGAIMAMFGGVFGTVFGGRGTPRSSGGEDIQMQNLGASRNSRIRGFQNPDDQRRDSQLYNGNSLNFEPRRDDEDENNGR
ncbi:hypothetical protein F5Y18DRAFT_401019 [Xylariaceae sp. FL1019]|nr:hypothetical protein F5Y18DRAFT_401019 [Xylariaceae sp. FL1019]